jgi:hypothetical protein
VAAIAGRSPDILALQEVTAQSVSLLSEALRTAGRDPSTLVHSAMVNTVIGADQADFSRRTDAFLDAFAIEPAKRAAFFESRRGRLIMGTPDEARAMVRRYAEAGVERLMLQDFLPWDLEMIDLPRAHRPGLTRAAGGRVQPAARRPRRCLGRPGIGSGDHEAGHSPVRLERHRGEQQRRSRAGPGPEGPPTGLWV